jgi:transcription elongation factor Elf1
MKNLHTIFICCSALVAGFWCVSCNDNTISSIPDFPVYMNLDLNTTYPTFKDNPNQYLWFKEQRIVTDRIGFGGILVYCSFNNNIEYYAFDMACPYEAKRDIRVYPNDNIGQVVCEECGSVYDVSMNFGNPISGPANESKKLLKRYRAALSGNNILVITR